MVLGHNALISLEALGGLQGCKGTGQSSASGQCGLQNGGGGLFRGGGGWAVGRFLFFLGSLSRRKRFCISGFQRSRSVPTEHATAVSVSNPFFFFSEMGEEKKKVFVPRLLCLILPALYEFKNKEENPFVSPLF